LASSGGQNTRGVHEDRQFMAKGGCFTLEDPAAVGELHALVTTFLDPGLLLRQEATAVRSYRNPLDAVFGSDVASAAIPP
jgi:hypothetical protein